MQISWQEQFSDRVIHDADNWQDLFVGFPIYMSTLAANYKKDAIYDVLICFRQFANQRSYATKWQTKAKLLRMTTQRWHTYTHRMFSHAVITSLQQKSPESGEFRVLRKIVRIIPPNVDGWLFPMVRHFGKQFSCRSDRKTAKFSLIDWQRCFGLCQWTEQLTIDSNMISIGPAFRNGHFGSFVTEAIKILCWLHWVCPRILMHHRLQGWRIW